MHYKYMNETTPQTSGWTRQPDGSWEGVINDTSYFIIKEDGKYYIYRQAGCEHVDTAPDLMTAVQLVSKREALGYV